MKIKKILKMLLEDGWYIVRIKGSHRQLKHSNKTGLVTLAGKPNDDLAKGTENNILKQARLGK
ncbi:MAG: addiction module toxin, HicA family [Desulfobacteraceae bacterium 4572_130]|nr:MAG: addiction module toxin, HicA family [Desulfobacteraceae bacterium 4572_130]